MRYKLHYLLMLLASSALLSGPAAAAPGGISYRARVVHNNRAYISSVEGSIDLTRDSFTEKTVDSYVLDWRQVPGDFVETSPALPVIWGRSDETCQQFAGGLPSYNSPLLRHFIVGQVIGAHTGIVKGSSYLGGQLEILESEFDATGFEIIAKFMGTPLVIVGRHHESGGEYVVEDLAVLGVHEELYQYFIDEIELIEAVDVQVVDFPEFNPADYVEFHPEAAAPVPIRPVKDWLVFQAHLPNGRPLNLVFDSGAETMIVDNMVLELDAGLKPSGEMVVAGAFNTEKMNLYEGFSFIAGGAEFKNLPVAGMQLTSLAYGADLRIHGVVGNEILRLCRLDIDLESGQLSLTPPDPDHIPTGEKLPITFIHDMPYITAGIHGEEDSLVMLDTGQRTGLQVNIDYLEQYELGDELVMNGFLGDITGGLQPRFMLEQLDVSLGVSTFDEAEIDALMSASYDYEGQQVVGSVGFSLFAGHYSGMTFDYQNKALYLRDPALKREFTGQPEAWNIDHAGTPLLLAHAGEAQPEASPADTNDEYTDPLQRSLRDLQSERGRSVGSSNMEDLPSGSIGDVRSSAPGLRGLGFKPGGNPGEQLYREKLIASTRENSQVVQLKEDFGKTGDDSAVPTETAVPPDEAIIAEADLLSYYFRARAATLLQHVLDMDAKKAAAADPANDEFWQTRSRSRFKFPPLQQ